MRQPGDLAVGRSGDPKREFTAVPPRRGERRGSNGFQNAWKIIWGMLREIFDESAYDRFLQRTRATRSIESYRSFVREREAVIAKRPRCC